MLKSKTAKLLVFVLGLFLLLAACAQPQSPAAAPTAASAATPAPATVPAATPAPTPAPVAAPTETPKEPDSAKLEAIKAELTAAANEVNVSADAVTFKDDSGRDAITIKKNPQKVAVLYGSHACLYTEAGGKVSVGIGGESASELYMDQIGRDIMKDEGVVTVATSSSGKTWDVEAILAEQPDLIICSTAMNGYSTISGPAEAASIPVIALTYSGVNDYLKWFKVFCNISGKPELWDSVANVTAEEIANIMLKVPTENNPRVLSLYPLTDRIDANLASSDMGVIIEQLGGVNVATEMAPDMTAVRVEIDLETMFAANPEMIFIQCIHSVQEVEEGMEKLIADNPIWANLHAVKNGKVYYMPKALYQYRPNHRYNESYRMLATLMYPDVEF